MKHSLLASAMCILLFASCNTQVKEEEPIPVGGFAKGADISWLTEQESDGIKFYDDNGKEADCVALLKACGMNSVRLRVWVNHSTGWCNKADVLEKAKRAYAQRQRLMIDFHYSDFFCDPGKQDIPAAWESYDIDQMCDAVAKHTKDILQAIKDLGITPEWVQVGNETTNGMLWPMGKLWDDNGDIDQGWQHYVRLSNSGYNAVKEVFPEAKVVIHIDNAYESRSWWYKKFASLGGKCDVIGLSHYPQANSSKTWSEMNSLCATDVSQLAQNIHKPIIIAEVGTKSSNQPLAAKVMNDFIEKVCSIDSCVGVFYWEPQVYGGWKPAEYTTLGWGAYDMGAFQSTGQVSEALKLLFAIDK